MANEELIVHLKRDCAFLAKHGYKRFSGNIAAAITALEAAESRALAAEAKHGKTADSLRIERQGFNSRMNAIEKAHRILGAAIQDGIYPEMAGEREMFCSVDLKAKGPTREDIRAAVRWAVGHALGQQSGPTMDNKFRSVHQITEEAIRRLFPQEQEPKQ